MVSLAYRRRALPIAWTWVRCARGHSGSRKQLALLDYVKRLLPGDHYRAAPTGGRTVGGGSRFSTTFMA